MNKQTNHTSKMKGQYSYNRLQVLWLTGMSEESLNLFQYEMGVEWLINYTGENVELLRQLMRGKLIWDWWLLQWNIRDDKVVLQNLFSLNRKEAFIMYRAAHQYIFEVAHPSYVILSDSYTRMIGGFKSDDIKL